MSGRAKEVFWFPLKHVFCVSSIEIKGRAFKTWRAVHDYGEVLKIGVVVQEQDQLKFDF